jgi:hypothetical protein
MYKYLFASLIFIGCQFRNKKISEKGFLSKENIDLNKKIDSIKNTIKEGDIIFRGGTDIESSIIRDFSYKDKMFSHCGIILKKSNQLLVTHIIGGITNPDGTILAQSLQDFLKYPDNECAGIYEIKYKRNELSAIYKYLDSVKKNKVTFDLRFNLFTKQQLYCTEMLVDAISFAKRDTLLFPPTTFSLKNTKYFSICNSGTNFLFYPIDVFQHSKLLKQKAVFYFPNYAKTN